MATVLNFLFKICDDEKNCRWIEPEPWAIKTAASHLIFIFALLFVRRCMSFYIDRKLSKVKHIDNIEYTGRAADFGESKGWRIMEIDKSNSF